MKEDTRMMENLKRRGSQSAQATRLSVLVPGAGHARVIPTGGLPSMLLYPAVDPMNRCRYRNVTVDEAISRVRTSKPFADVIGLAFNGCQHSASGEAERLDSMRKDSELVE